MAARNNLKNRQQSDLDMCNNQIVNATFEYWNKEELPKTNLFEGRHIYLLKDYEVSLPDGTRYKYQAGSVCVCHEYEDPTTHVKSLAWYKQLSSLQSQDISEEVAQLWKYKSGVIRNYATYREMQAAIGKTGGEEWEMDLAIVAKDETKDGASTLYVAYGDGSGTKAVTEWRFLSKIFDENVPASETVLANGTSIISNKASDQGACMKFVHTDGTRSGIAVHNSENPNGVLGEIYAVDMHSLGTRFTVTKDKMYYTKGSAATPSASDEITVVDDIEDKPDYVESASITEITTGSVEWGRIVGDIDNQTDLKNALAGKSNVVVSDTLTTGDTIAKITVDGIVSEIKAQAGSTPAWGGIAGNIAEQTDLQNALNDKADASALADEVTRAQTEEAKKMDKLPEEPFSHTQYKFPFHIEDPVQGTDRITAKFHTLEINNGTNRAEYTVTIPATDIANNKAGLYTKAMADAKLNVPGNAPIAPHEVLRLPYFFEQVVGADKITVKSHNVKLDNNPKVDEIFTLDVMPADVTANKAGLYSKSIDDNIKADIAALISDTETGSKVKTYSQEKIESMVSGTGTYWGNYVDLTALKNDTARLLTEGLAVGDTAVVLSYTPPTATEASAYMFKYTGGTTTPWWPLYPVHTSTFTTTQWASIDSGATAEKIAKIAENTDRLDNLSSADINDFEEAVKAQIVDTVYPVGAIYISVNPVNPSTIFAGTTWEAYAEGRTLLGVGPGHMTGGETGGYEEIMLTVDQMPRHSHENDKHSHGGITDMDGHHQHRLQIKYYSKAPGLSGADHPVQNGKDNDPIYSDDDGSHQHIFTTTKSSITIKENGGGQAHNNMMPYITTYIFKRTG